MSEKAAIVKLNAGGEVVSCAKGYDSAKCGYTPGAKVCGACGAMAVSVKKKEGTDTKAHKKNKLNMAAINSDLDDEMSVDEDTSDDETEDMELVDEEEEDDDDEEEGDVEALASTDEDEEDEDIRDLSEEADDDEIDEMLLNRSSPRKKKKDAKEEDEDEGMQLNEFSLRKKMRRHRLGTMGYKSADFDDEAFVCGFDRKVYPGGANICDSCPGGCVSEKGMPALIEVEGMAEDMFRGKVLDSGYSDESDLFIVDVERKDGKPVEVFFDGSTGEVMGWHMLTQEVVQVKSALQNKVMISFGEAADIAVKSVEGDIIAVEPDVFEGYDVYAVEIEGVNGKSYDVFVGLDGEVLGYDEYTQEEASEIEAEAAEIALKRAYTEESRDAMAKAGQALPDGSYPIKDEADLKNAIQAYGRAKDKTAAKAHIMKRAVDLGLEETIPLSWVSKEDMEKAKNDSTGEEKSEATDFLSNLMEFEMLALEEEINAPKPE